MMKGYKKFIWILVTLLFFLFTVNSFEVCSSVGDSNYPTYVPKYPVRIDYYTNQPVTENRMSLLDAVEGQTTLDELRRKLQCVRHDGNIDGERGIFTLIDLMNMTQRLLK